MKFSFSLVALASAAVNVDAFTMLPTMKRTRVAFSPVQMAESDDDEGEVIMNRYSR